MELLARLEPRSDPNEILVPSVSERVPLELKTNGGVESIVLGRGATTAISDHTIGQSVVQISFDEFSRDEQTVRATLMKDASHCRVYVNGQRWPDNREFTFLASGDVIALDGLRYEYRLHISEVASSTALQQNNQAAKKSSPSEEVISVASSPSISPIQNNTPAAASQTMLSESGNAATEDAVTVPKDKASRLADEIQCSVCLEIQVCPRTLAPCGHSFCFSCLHNLKTCPQCREHIYAHVPAVQLDGLISMLVSVPNLLDKSDVEHYNERRKGKKQTPVVHNNQKKRPAKRRRVQHRAINNSNAPWEYEMPPSAFLNPPPWAAAAMAGSPLSVNLSRTAGPIFAPPFAAASASSSPNRRRNHGAAAAFVIPAPSSASQPLPRHEYRTGTSSASAISID